MSFIDRYDEVRIKLRENMKNELCENLNAENLLHNSNGIKFTSICKEIFFLKIKQYTCILCEYLFNLNHNNLYYGIITLICNILICCKLAYKYFLEIKPCMYILMLNYNNLYYDIIGLIYNILKYFFQKIAISCFGSEKNRNYDKLINYLSIIICTLIIYLLYVFVCLTIKILVILSIVYFVNWVVIGNLQNQKK
jgi:hypothetical protein